MISWNFCLRYSSEHCSWDSFWNFFRIPSSCSFYDYFREYYLNSFGDRFKILPENRHIRKSYWRNLWEKKPWRSIRRNLLRNPWRNSCWNAKFMEKLVEKFAERSLIHSLWNTWRMNESMQELLQVFLKNLFFFCCNRIVQELFFKLFQECL